jgi:aspartate/methionine/tyrosine aminotransferase
MYYDLDAGNDWQPDFEQLEQMPLERVKILWTCYPHMPTGAAAQRTTFERLVAFARKHDILVVNDNPYGLILNEEHLSLLQVDGAKDCCIELNSMSKSHNMPGWRVGMLATNAEFVKWILKVKSNIDSGTFRPLQLAAAKAYTNDDAWHHEANFQTYAERRAIAEEIMQALGCTYDAKAVGMFLWGKIPDTCASGEALADEVLSRARTFITPGFIFGSAGERYIRLSLCQKPEKMRQALERIKAAF